MHINEYDILCKTIARKAWVNYSEDFSNLTVVKCERVKITLQVVYKFYKLI